MKTLDCSMPGLQLVEPRALSDELVFRVYRGPSQIAFAQLNHGSQRERRHYGVVIDHEPSISYCLHNIVVSQNYRHLGIGSALLDEVVAFCRDHGVSRIYGEAKGEVVALKRWYASRGFQTGDRDFIQIDLS